MPAFPSRLMRLRPADENSFIQARMLVALGALSLLGMGGLGLLAAPVPSGKPAAYPSWWYARGVIVPTNPTNASPAWPGDYPTSDDYAAINQGQLKNLATKAYQELQAVAPTNVWSTSQGTNLSTMVTGWSTTNGDSYAALNEGQLKTVAQPFYDVLVRIGYATTYPWGASTDDYQGINIGQVKNLFSFDVGLDTDADGLPDWWEMKYLGHLTNVASAQAPAGNGFTLAQDYQQGNDPNNFWSQGGATITPTLTIVSGNNQTGIANAFTQPLIVRVMNGSSPIANVPITFSSEDTLLTANPANPAYYAIFMTTTDANGYAQVYGQLTSESDSTNTVTATCGTQTVTFTENTDDTPAEPQNITMTPGPVAGQITLHWNNVASNATYFDIHQSTDGVTWTHTATISDPTITTYVVTGLDVNQSYYFGVAAGN